MAYEIERKYLVDTSIFDISSGGQVSIQAYLEDKDGSFSQIRISRNLTRHKGYINIKGFRESKSATRLEVRATISEEESIQLLNDIHNDLKIFKKRITQQFHGNEWVVDVYEKNNKGLVIAEIEIPYEEYKFVKPEWAIVDITDDDYFYNYRLINNPWTKWAINKYDEQIPSHDIAEFSFEKMFPHKVLLRVLPLNKAGTKLYGNKPFYGYAQKQNDSLIIENIDENTKINIDINDIFTRGIELAISNKRNIQFGEFLKIKNNKIIYGDKDGNVTVYSMGN